jgi:hypothetical protein
MEVRRAVLGDAHVDASFENRNEFNEELQDLITRSRNENWRVVARILLQCR